MTRIVRLGVLAAALAYASSAAAVDLGDGALSVSGFGRWAYGRTDGNAFIVGREDGKADNVGLALNFFARPSDRLAVSAQVFYDIARINIDWAFAEWRFHDALRLRVGQVKLPFGAYMEVKDVGTLRPFYNLPVSIYSFADIAAESYYGAGLTGAFPRRLGFELSYDVFGGSLWIESNDRFRAAPAATGTASNAAPGTPPQTYFTKLDNAFGGRLTIGTPLPGLTLRVSGFRGEIADLGKQVQSAGPAGANFYSYGASAEYLNDWLEIRSEWFGKQEGRYETRQETHTGYVEVAVRFLEHWQVAGRAERARYSIANKTVSCGTIPGSGTPGTPCSYTFPDSLTKHDELAVGLNYWFSRNMVLKTSFHWIDGNRFAYPEYQWLDRTTDGLSSATNPADVQYDPKTRLFLVGAQFAF